MKENAIRLRILHGRNSAVLSIALALAGCGGVPLSPAPTGGKAATQRNASANIPALPPAGSGRGGYYLDDGPGDNIPDGLHELPDAEPKVEPYARAANRPYVVFGKRYTPFTDDRPFKQRGMGSWYGKKFHGQKTSSGELYDMYKMTAAHPTMPLPSYARVTNLGNGRQVIVRVNDRGPFHSSRIIDLSYAAALKLGYLGRGSAELEVERLLPEEIERISRGKQAPAQPAEAMPALANRPPEMEVETAAVKPLAFSADASAPASLAPGFYIQLGAYSQAGNAEAVRSRLMRNWAGTLPRIDVMQNGALYRLHSGPFASRAEAADAARQLENAGISTTIVQR